MTTTSFRLDEELQKKLESTAARLKRSKGWLINEAVRQYIEREEIITRMLSETQEALADIEAGRVVSGEEVLNWLKTWGTEAETNAPL
jgi:predicted transcriptional regulator